MKKDSFLLTLFIFISSVIIGQTASINGFMYDAENGEPLIFTNVYLKGTQYGAVTDVNGFYSITKIEPGDYVLTVQGIGYETTEQKVSLKANNVIQIKMNINKSQVNLKTVEISAEKQEMKTEVKMSVVKITPKEISQIPAVGGQADIAQYLQVLPGVVFTGDQGGQLYIRGGSPVQNKVLLDGMIVYNPFHSIGLFSVFETDIIRNADIYTGGFGAEYGGRISSIMDITTKDGNRKYTSGKVGLNPFGASALLEGPLKKAKDINDGSISYLLTTKTSYLEQSSKLLYSYIDKDGLPFGFTDAYGKVTFNGNSGNKVNFFGLSFNDRVNFEDTEINWQNLGGGANFVLVPTSTSTLIEGRFAYSEYEISQQDFGIETKNSKVGGFNFGLDATYFVVDNEIKFGMEVLGFSTDFSYLNSSGGVIDQIEYTTEAGFYGKYKFKVGNLVVDPSMRMHYYVSLDEVSPEPRLGIKYNVTDRFRLKAAGGLYSQNLISATSDRDVVNLFYGFLSGSENLQETFVDENGERRDVTTNLQKARHLIAGFEVDATKYININIEGYYKRFSQLTNLNRYKIFDERERDRPEIYRKDFIVETGDAYGIDFVTKFHKKRLYLWAVYSIGVIDRWDGLSSYHPIFDRRHNVNLVGNYLIGNDMNWELSARWNLGSGFPFTPQRGFYEGFTFEDGLETDVLTDNGDIQIYYGELNTKRLPYYHRLDLNVKYTYGFSKNSDLEINLGVTNAYSRKNIFYVNRISSEVVRQLPIMPTAGLTLTF